MAEADGKEEDPKVEDEEDADNMYQSGEDDDDDGEDGEGGVGGLIAKGEGEEKEDRGEGPSR